ncbi:uncharacterized protein troap isoform X1 [Labrus mixtus]|uniref:uncharacterized protein troap isoform X1 n=1 Tax=Labrus mixtus TaxID=508554 RepID=UPI0029C0C7E7|nr:uncharacterized protein troap isoform X1 [Labrus mixtus]XP_060913588.1 uncharacterized protein troap isoform X1 [Labrus mixtus]
MDSSPVLRPQSQNKIRSDFQRPKKEHNKMQVHPRPSKLQSTRHLSDENIENQDPGNSPMGKKAPVRPGVSRLPVLAKSLRLQTPVDFGQSHSRWEEKPLAGKAKNKRPCTRPIPFNLTQSKGSRVASENQHPLTQPRTGCHAVQPDNNACDGYLKSQNTNAKPAKHPSTLNRKLDSKKGTGNSHFKATENTPQLSGHSVPSVTFKTSNTLSQPLAAVSNNALHQNHSTTLSAKSTYSAETCLDNMNLLSLKDPTISSNSSQNMQLTTQGNYSKSLTEKGENFQSDHAALLSILRNEGVSAPCLGSATPQSKAYNYVPQRVSIMTRQKVGPTTGSVKSVQFSPDPAALQSILLNEGVKAEGPFGATPQHPVRPSGRGTSVYTAQRVPLRKNHAEGGPVAVLFSSVALNETPLKKWTPQRVRDIRHQPMSAMRWHMSLSTQQSPYGSTPGLRSCKTNLQPRQEEIVQRLFDDQEDQQSVTVKDPETQAKQLPGQDTTVEHERKNKPLCEGKVETGREVSSVEDGDEEEEKEQRKIGEQPFFQAPHRESVIFFSTGRKLLRAPRFEKEDKSAHQEQHGPVSSAQKKMLPVSEERPCIPEPTNHIVLAVQSLQREVIVQKTCPKSPAVAMLRKRLPQLEELRLDEEVSTYTSVAVQAALGFLPPRPRCGNPLASTLHFEELSTFVPISCSLMSGPSSPQCSPLQER